MDSSGHLLHSQPVSSLHSPANLLKIRTYRMSMAHDVAVPLMKWAQSMGYRVGIDVQGGYTTVHICVTKQDQTMVSLHNAEHVHTRVLSTTTPHVPFDLQLADFEVDPDLHWSVYEANDAPTCGLCNQAIVEDMRWCVACHQARFLRCRSILWLMATHTAHIGLPRELISRILGTLVVLVKRRP